MVRICLAREKKGKKEENVLANEYGLKLRQGESGDKKEAESEKHKTRLAINYSHFEWTRFLYLNEI